MTTAKQKSGIGRQEYCQKQEVRIREILLAFYTLFFICNILDKIFPQTAVFNYLARITYLIQAPAIMYAAGCLMGLLDTDSKTFRKKALSYALKSYFLFFFIALFNDVFIMGYDAFTTGKDLLTAVRIPNISAIFLALCYLFFICAFFFKYLEYCIRQPLIFIAVSLIGFSFAFIPPGYLGYGLTGVVFGGDTFGCVSILVYLFAFLGGLFYVRNRSTGLLCLPWLAAFAVMTAMGGILLILHRQSEAFKLIGAVLAFIGLVLIDITVPLYEKVEAGFSRLYKAIGAGRIRIKEKRTESKRFDSFFYYLDFCVLFLIISYLIFYPYLDQDKTLIWSVDGLGQYIPKAYRFMQYIPSIFKDLLHGNKDFIQYDFATGLGSSLQISHEPVYWLYLLFRPSQLETAYSFLVYLRYLLAGISMAALLRYFKKSSFSCYVGSIVYIFSGYAIYTGTKHGQFLVPMILFPILIIAMEEVIARKKWYLLTIVTGISLLCSYYFLYMNTIAAGIYFIARILCDKKYRSLSLFIGRGLLIVMSYCIGAAMGSISLFTAFGRYLGSSRSGGNHVSGFLTNTPLFYRQQWISDFFISYISDSYSPGLWLKLGIAPIALLALILLFTRTRRKELKLIFVLLTIFCLIPLSGYIFNGFSNVSNRWCYIYITALAFILAEYLDDFFSLSDIEIKIMTGITLYYGMVIFLSTKYRTDKVFGAFGLLVVTLLLIILLNSERFHFPEKTGHYIIFTVTILSVIFNANMYITNTSGTEPHLDTYVEKGSSMKKMSATALKYLNEAVPDQEEKGFFRSTNLMTYGNVRSSGLIYGYNDISTFTSTMNGNMVNYNNMMANCDHNIVSIYSYNFRTILHELASVRYIGSSDKISLPLPFGYKKIFEKEEDTTTYSIYENQYALPIGYTYSSIASEEAAEKYSGAEKQDLSMQSAIMSEADCKKNTNLSMNADPDLSVHKISIRDMELDNVTLEDGLLTVGEDGGTMTFHFDGDSNCETYLSFKGDIVFPKDGAEHFCSCLIKTDELSYSHKFRVDAYSTGQEEYLFNLGYHEKPVDSCTITFTEPGTLTCEEICVYTQDMNSYVDYVDKLKEDVLENVVVDKNTVSGTIDTAADKLLAISIPYQNGWTAYVDGKETETCLVNYQYTGINLPPGHHEIKLQYHIPGLKISLIVTVCGFCIFIVLLLWKFIRKQQG